VAVVNLKEVPKKIRFSHELQLTDLFEEQIGINYFSQAKRLS
jgi:hypothetical protein